MIATYLAFILLSGPEPTLRPDGIVVTNRHASHARPVIRRTQGVCSGTPTFIETRIDTYPRSLRVGYGSLNRVYDDSIEYVQVFLRQQVMSHETLFCDPEGGFHVRLMSPHPEGDGFFFTTTYFTASAEFRVQHGPTRATDGEIAVLYDTSL